MPINIARYNQLISNVVPANLCGWFVSMRLPKNLSRNSLPVTTQKPARAYTCTPGADRLQSRRRSIEKKKLGTSIYRTHSVRRPRDFRESNPWSPSFSGHPSPWSWPASVAATNIEIEDNHDRPATFGESDYYPDEQDIRSL